MGDGSSRLRVTSHLMALLSTGISGLSYISDNPPGPVVWAFPSGRTEAVGCFSWTSCKAPDSCFDVMSERLDALVTLRRTQRPGLGRHGPLG